MRPSLVLSLFTNTILVIYSPACNATAYMLGKLRLGNFCNLLFPGLLTSSMHPDVYVTDHFDTGFLMS